MKLIVQIPCHDEAASIAETIAGIPKTVAGFDRVELLLIDDGCTDDTVAIALRAGVDHVVRQPTKQGLARTFMHGIDASLREGADVIVNLDGDNQYDASCIPDLVRPLLEKRAEIVVGDRDLASVRHFPFTKRALSRLGSWVVGVAATTRIPDSASGFRAFSRSAALRLVVQNDFTYTHETLIQASQRRMAVVHVPITVRPTPRASRLSRSTTTYVTSSADTIVRAYTTYRPLHFFLACGALLATPGVAIGVRFLWFYFTDGGAGHVQSLLLATLLVILGFQTAMMGVLADVVAGNRRLLEEVLWRTRTLEIESSRQRIAERREHDVISHVDLRQKRVETGKNACG